MFYRKGINLFTRSARVLNVSSKAEQSISYGKYFSSNPWYKYRFPIYPFTEIRFLSLRNKSEEKEKNWEDIESFNGEEKYLTRICNFVTAFIIILLGVRETLCENSVQNENSGELHELNEKLCKTKLATGSKTNTSKANDNECGTSATKPSATPDISVDSQMKVENPTKKVKSPGRSEEEFPKQEPDIIIPVLPKEENKMGVKIKHVIPRFFSEQTLTLKTAVDLSRNLLSRRLAETGAPGVAVAVSVNGKCVWSEGVGYADIENSVRMSPFTVLRIASISKPLTMVAVCRLVEEGKLDLDAPIQKYVPSFPQKIINGEVVTITTRHLLNHTSGIRHYWLKDEEELEKGGDKKEEEGHKKDEDEEEEETDGNERSQTGEENKLNMKQKIEKKRKKLQELIAKKALAKKPKVETREEFDLEEYYIKEEFKSIDEALQLFKDDDLLFKPGDDYHYSTHGYTLVSAVVEGAAKKPFTKIMLELFRDLGLENTSLDQNEPIIFRRSRNYYRDRHGSLRNSPYVDNSYKWAGGGFLSTVGNLTKFGNAMLFSYQADKQDEPEAFLKSDIMREIWSPSFKTKPAWNNAGSYGLGWRVVLESKPSKAYTNPERTYFSHTGGAIGCSSVILIMVTGEAKDAAPHGIVVSIIANLQNVGLHQTALKIATIFERIHEESKVVGAIAGHTKSQVYTLRNS